MNPMLTKGFEAAAAIAASRFVAFDTPATATTVAQATAATSEVLGISDRLVQVAQGQMADIHLLGIALLELGGTVQAGDRLTSGAAGVGVVIAAGAGETRHYGAIALQPGIAGDLIDVLITHGTIHA